MAIVHRTLLLVSLALVMACTQGKHLSLVDASNPAWPVFCISTQAECEGQTTSLAHIMVAELKESENYRISFNNAVWVAAPRDGESTNTTTKIIHYGRPPSTKWKNEVEPVPLQPFTLYSVEDSIYFYWREPSGTFKSAFFPWIEKEKAILQFKSLPR